MQEGWKIIPGVTPILFIACHNVPHLRRRTIKKGEPGTAELVELLSKNINSWGIISRMTCLPAGRVQKDPNWYRHSPFRQAVKKIVAENQIKVAFDIHGKNLDAPDLLTLYPNETFKKNYPFCLKGLVVKKFLNNGQLTITEDLDNNLVAGVELEIRSDGRIPKGANFKTVIATLEQILTSLTSQGFTR
jgi:hypothetical protein